MLSRGPGRPRSLCGPGAFRFAAPLLAGWMVLYVSGCSPLRPRVGVSIQSEGDSTMVAVGATGRGGDGVTDLSTPPVVGPPPVLELPRVQRFSLDVGVEVVLVERPGLPLVQLELLAGGGTWLQEGRAGLAELTLDLMDEGTTTRSAMEIAEAVEELGAELEMGVARDHTWVSLNILTPHLVAGLELMADVVLRPSFPPADLERVRDERMARVLQDADEPRTLADVTFSRVVFGEGHPYGDPLLGTRTSLEGLRREDVERYHRTVFRCGNVRLVVVGDVTEADLRPLLEGAFAGWPRDGMAWTPPDGGAPTPPAMEGEIPIYLVDRPGAPQSEIRVGKVGVARGGEDEHAVTVLNTILGGSFTSRLMQNLREDKGFTYGAGSSFVMRRLPGPFVARSAVHTPVTHQAVLEFLSEIRRLREEPVSEEELARARSYVALRLPQRFETLEDVADRLGEPLLHDLPPDYWENYVPGILAVSAAAVQEAALTHLSPEGLVVLVAGDRATVEEPLRALGLGPVILVPAAGDGV
jgi:zinc protease